MVRCISVLGMNHNHSYSPLVPSGSLESTGDVKACLAVLTFVITSAAKFGVDAATLSAELQQLGLPKGEL